MKLELVQSQLNSDWDDLLQRMFLLFVTISSQDTVHACRKLIINQTSLMECLWLGTYLINLNGFQSRAVDFHQLQPWKTSLFPSFPSVQQLQSLDPTRILWNWPNFPSLLQAAIWLLCTFHFSLNNWFNPPLPVIFPIKYQPVILIACAIIN